MYFLRMFNYNNSLRCNVGTVKRDDLFVKSFFGHRQAVYLRSYFDKWRLTSHKRSTALAVNDEGPIVEESLDEKIKLANYFNFLKD